MRLRRAIPVSVRMRPPTASLLKQCSAMAWYLKGYRTDKMLAEALWAMRCQLLSLAERRGIDPLRALAGLPELIEPAPERDLPPRPAVDPGPSDLE
jgi:hypothetical protein